VIKVPILWGGFPRRQDWQIETPEDKKQFEENFNKFLI
jgi:hypothetical protein